ncbi:MAG TPA: UDP-N-acetylmuramoyl-L-alanyl-D-glutamate--2,6-diaminopimelate ligase [Candidatus Saccharimonadales bacterium]|jgi:UDP-N-acetylmuramoyl-L-alanyl-D-glutamate--2,6-diaminopimelate ligase|nr:UDP-N-acetylmuramoyl-L-alanyl-D-glutamate--2,6-diaminopimelate ligase [Candidatus Saccharimonadales bacterium]
MIFSELLQGLTAPYSGGPAVISGLDYDSRRVRPGWVFVAMKGETTDGNDYIDAALEKGAVAVISDSIAQRPRPGIGWVTVEHGRRALAVASANFYLHPVQKLKITGVTGTNGKTTTTFLLESILNFCGRKPALIGTIEYHVGGQTLPAPHTTPESLELNRIFAQSLSAGSTDVVMEVSSHALEQGRVYGIPYEVAVFTNLTRDHLDYHKDMESYFAAKRLLFEGTGAKAPRVAVLNAEDEYGSTLLEVSRRSNEQSISYGISHGDFHPENLELNPQGTEFDLVTPQATIKIRSKLLGQINVYNTLAAAAAAVAQGCPLNQVAAAIGQFKQVPGRFERVDCGQPFTVVVDYAHTDDALRNLTSIARGFAARHGAQGKVITVFGCGGDRDRAKRPLMGRVAGNGSDLVVLTSDNPRSEDPLAILEDALAGLKSSDARYTVEPDRRKAIAIALAEAIPGDIVLIAGKGHEKVQVTRDGTFPFDDVQVAREALKLMGHNSVSGGER